MKQGGCEPLESPSSQNSSPAALLLSSRATISPIGLRRLQTGIMPLSVDRTLVSVCVCVCVCVCVHVPVCGGDVSFLCREDGSASDV